MFRNKVSKSISVQVLRWFPKILPEKLKPMLRQSCCCMRRVDIFHRFREDKLLDENIFTFS